MHIEINKNIPSVTTDVVYIKLEQSNQSNYQLSTWRRAIYMMGRLPSRLEYCTQHLVESALQSSNGISTIE